MLKVIHTIFADNVIAMADGRRFIAGMYPGVINVSAAGPGSVALFDLSSDFLRDVPGEFRLSAKVINTDGSTVAEVKDFLYNISDAEEHVYFSVNRILVPVVGPGRVSVLYRENDGEWMEGGNILMRVPVNAGA